MDKPVIDKRISQKADEFAQKEYISDSYERYALFKGYYWGYKDAEKDIGWISVKDKLPEEDEEVIVLTDELNTAPVYKIAFGHIVNKDIAVDYDGWNIEGVRYWMSMPEIPKEEVK